MKWRTCLWGNAVHVSASPPQSHMESIYCRELAKKNQKISMFCVFIRHHLAICFCLLRSVIKFNPQSGTSLVEQVNFRKDDISRQKVRIRSRIIPRRVPTISNTVHTLQV